jgi:hypothetical protein
MEGVANGRCCICLVAIARLRGVRGLAALSLIVQPGSEAAVGEGARRLLHSSRSSGLDLRSRSSSVASVSISAVVTLAGTGSESESESAGRLATSGSHWSKRGVAAVEPRS